MKEKNITSNVDNQNMKLPRMLVGTDEFYDLVVNSDVFVDKSIMIEERLEDSGKVILIAHPRRFGKSLKWICSVSSLK